jgi:hypothetical protein
MLTHHCPSLGYVGMILDATEASDLKVSEPVESSDGRRRQSVELNMGFFLKVFNYTNLTFYSDFDGVQPDVWSEVETLVSQKMMVNHEAPSRTF